MTREDRAFEAGRTGRTEILAGKSLTCVRANKETPRWGGGAEEHAFRASALGALDATVLRKQVFTDKHVSLWHQSRAQGDHMP